MILKSRLVHLVKALPYVQQSKVFTLAIFLRVLPEGTFQDTSGTKKKLFSLMQNVCFCCCQDKIEKVNLPGRGTNANKN